MRMETFKDNMWIIECVVIKRLQKTSELMGIYGTIFADLNFGDNHIIILPDKKLIIIM